MGTKIIKRAPSPKAADTCADRLTSARFLDPNTIQLTFGDASFSLAIKSLEMPLDQIRWETARASPTGDAMIVESTEGEKMPIDTLSLRYLVDPSYAAKIDKSIRDVHMTPAEANEAAEFSRIARDPRWNKVGDEDDL